MEKRSDLCLRLRSDTDERSGTTLRLLVQPAQRRTSLGFLIDAFGNDYYKEQHRIASGVGEGWIYCIFTNPETGRDEPKNSYVKSIDWDGHQLRSARESIAATSRAHATVKKSTPCCSIAILPTRGSWSSSAALELEMKGYFAIDTLTTEPRWRSDSIYLFAP